MASVASSVDPWDYLRKTRSISAVPKSHRATDGQMLRYNSSIRKLAAMVYVDWAAEGICKFWMLQRCYAGNKCQYKHPKNWRHLWDEHIAKQEEDQERGIPLPQKPDINAVGVAAREWEEQPGGRAQHMQKQVRSEGEYCRKETHEEEEDHRPGLISQSWREERSEVEDDRKSHASASYTPEPKPKPAVPNLTWPNSRSRYRRDHNQPLLHRAIARVRSTADMAPKRMSNGEVKHPPRSEIRVSAPYMSQAALEKKLYPSPSTTNPTNEGVAGTQERSIAEAREDSVRLQGCTWIDNVRRALELPIRTYTTACVYYHKLRLAHPNLLSGADAAVQATVTDACAASLLTACKVDDTLKKSRDILATAYNLKTATAHEHLGADDSLFDAPAKHVMVLERMVLESGGFDFRSKHPHALLLKIATSVSVSDEFAAEKRQVSKIAWTVLTDLHRTFAPLKQTSASMALASLELAAHLFATSSEENHSAVRDALQGFAIESWYTTREEIMETLLDALDLYTHHITSTALGPSYSLDDFLRIRLAMNKECAKSNLPRYTIAPDNSEDRLGMSNTSRVDNGHPTPVSPPVSDTHVHSQQQNTNRPQQDEIVHTYRFMVNPQRAAAERTEVQKYFVEEWEEYEEEIEVPVPRSRSRDRRDHRKDSEHPIRSREEREREKERLRDRERDLERERARLKDRDRERERDRRRYDDRDRQRDHRYDDDRRRRDERR